MSYIVTYLLPFLAVKLNDPTYVLGIDSRLHWLIS